MIYIINAIVVSFLAVLWEKNNWFNFILKLVFFGLAIANIVCALQAHGYIVKGLTQ